MTYDDPLLETALLQLGELTERVEELESSREDDQSEITKLTERLQKLIDGLDEQDRERGYRPSPPPRWWQLNSEERTDAVSRLQNWVEVVFRPGYGHLAMCLGDCWPEHDLALYLLDLLSELHAAVYHPRKSRPVPILTSAAEWHLRLLPAAADLLSRETKGGCAHSGSPFAVAARNGRAAS
jgi:hypothetical protein